MKQHLMSSYSICEQVIREKSIFTLTSEAELVYICCKDPKHQQSTELQLRPKSVQMGFDILPHYCMYLQKCELDLSGTCTD